MVDVQPAVDDCDILSQQKPQAPLIPKEPLKEFPKEKEKNDFKQDQKAVIEAVAKKFEENINSKRPQQQIEQEEKEQPPTEKDVDKKMNFNLVGLTERTVEGTATQSNIWNKLESLKNLFDEGYISFAEYQERKILLVDELTGTTTVKGEGSTMASTRKKGQSQRTQRKKRVTEEIEHRPPPNFEELSIETAIKHTFDPELQVWTKRTVQVRMDLQPFAKGGLRKAFYLQDLSESDSELYVGKISLDPFEEREGYFHDVELQLYAEQWAEKFNACDPPKKVQFIKAWILELIERDESPLCAVEKYISGPYRKHNNNFGFVSEEERNTPQAFSHFTYEASNHQVLICDIQGVDDLYTDPQMHTAGKGLGRGDLGTKGMSKFIQAHRCNRICKFFRLPAINSKEVDEGTIPSTYFMRKEVVVVQPNFPRRIQQQLPQQAPLQKDSLPPLLASSEKKKVAGGDCEKNPLSASLLPKEKEEKEEQRKCCCSIL
eukprot:TRINITY_DN3487_c0_g1_i1.p1 TRINITY_DN3487_c0_g1~~TRINITY_DN3487_c0_g1_i1.p1  ORF type:complete len:489 (+),score=129.55 TRINITY_DN3487_c0_g1_i1:115-1581(+)